MLGDRVEVIGRRYDQGRLDGRRLVFEGLASRPLGTPLAEGLASRPLGTPLAEGLTSRPLGTPLTDGEGAPAARA